MAVTVVAIKKKAKRRVIVLHRRRRSRFTPAQQDYQTWSHDFDTCLHGILESPTQADYTPQQLAQRCADIADAIRKVQEPRRPKGWTRW